jgi:hypothetical protein
MGFTDRVSVVKQRRHLNAAGTRGRLLRPNVSSLLRLGGDRLLFTFTDRSLQIPLGVEAVLGVEQSNAFTLQFGADRILIDTQTPPNESSGGGFGNTLTPVDGTLISAYSYRDGAGIIGGLRWCAFMRRAPAGSLVRNGGIAEL